MLELILLIFCVATCCGQYFPQEIKSKVTKEAFCKPPLNLNESDGFEYTQYSRLPLSGSVALDRDLGLASQVRENFPVQMYWRSKNCCHSRCCAICDSCKHFS